MNRRFHLKIPRYSIRNVRHFSLFCNWLDVTILIGFYRYMILFYWIFFILWITSLLCSVVFVRHLRFTWLFLLLIVRDPNFVKLVIDYIFDLNLIIDHIWIHILYLYQGFVLIRVIYLKMRFLFLCFNQF